MDLLPRDAVHDALATHYRAFAVVHHLLDVAIQETALRWEDRFPDLKDMDGSFLASNVRGMLDALRKKGPLPRASLTMVTVNNCGQHLFDGQGTRFRILERPLSQVSPGRLLPICEPETETLFGTVPSAAPYELAVLWTVNYKAKSLGKAVLAAASHIDNPRKAAIYAEEILPEPIPVTLGARPSNEDAAEPTEGFEDLFGDTGEGLGDLS